MDLGILAPLVTGVAAADRQPAFVVDSIEADKVKAPVDSDASARVRVHSNTRSLDVKFAAVPGAGSLPFRFRYCSEGYDRGWRDPIGVMRFAVRFDDAVENTILGEEFDAHGELPNGLRHRQPRLYERPEKMDVPRGRAAWWRSRRALPSLLDILGIAMIELWVLGCETGLERLAIEAPASFWSEQRHNLRLPPKQEAVI